MKSLNSRIATSALALSGLLSACVSPPVEAPKTTVEQQTNINTAQTVKNKVDLLFMIDDSASMSPKQEALKSKFQVLINAIQNFEQKADYHIGVITSDVTPPNFAGHCGLPTTVPNLNGALQKKGLAKANDPNCQGPPGNFIDYNVIDGTDNLPSGQDLATTFSCMATVVDANTSAAGARAGCGFEEQLEASYLALHNPPAANANFLRDDAILAVVYITDEDDCSVDANSDLLSSNPAYGPLNSYRCAQYGIYCDGMLLPPQPQASFQNCTPATPAQGGKLTDINKYINFFLKPKSAGGIKDDPNDVILAAITAPKDPVSTYQASGQANCGGTSATVTCTNINHSCNASADFFGDPSQRLSAVIKAAGANGSNTSICDADYTPALNAIAKLIVSALQPSCLTAPIKTKTVAGMKQPDCTVEDVTAGVPKSLPYCPTAGGQLPCWQESENPQCPILCDPEQRTYTSPAITISRDANINGGKAPDGTVAKVSCNTIALANEDPYSFCGGCPDGGNCGSTDGGT